MSGRILAELPTRTASSFLPLAALTIMSTYLSRSRRLCPSQLLKGGSSKWMNDSGANGFAWQEGNGALSVGVSQLHATITYTNSQAEHDKKHGFEEEFLA